MTPSIQGFVTRAQAGLVTPRSVSYNITPQHGGSVGHWGGTRQWTGNHARCLEIWRNWQIFHMQTHGWVDLAYTGGYCNHGFALAGRGLNVRTAANGTNVANQNHYAFVWIGGQGDPHPNQLAISAFEWWVQEARKAGRAGKRVRSHTDFTGSLCPGPQLVPHCRRLDNSDIIIVPSSTQPSAPTGEDMPSEWAKAAWNKITNLKTRTGQVVMSDSDPKGTVTREQLAVVLDRLGLLDSPYKDGEIFVAEMVRHMNNLDPKTTGAWARSLIQRSRE